MATNQQQVGALLKAVIAKGVETKDAVSTIKKLIEAKIFDLNDLTAENVPGSIEPSIRSKLLPGKKRASGTGGASSPSKRRKSSSEIVQPPVTSTPEYVMINRSPVLTLWATIVAMNLYPDLSLVEGLSLGSAVASHTAKAKGASLGIFHKKDEEVAGDAQSSSTPKDEKFEILGVQVQATKTDMGLRSIVEGEVQDPNKTWYLLKKRFQDSLGFVMDKMDTAAKCAGDSDELRAVAYQYYVHIRPDIPQGTKGWGAHGRLETRKLSDFHDRNVQKD